MEVRQLLPAMLDAVQQLSAGLIEEVVLIAAPGMEPVIGEVLERTSPDRRIRVVTGSGRRRELAGAAVAWTASGTATLECALLGIPMVVGYRLHPYSYALAKVLVRVPHIALVNLIAGHRAVPELVQSAWRPDKLIAHTEQVLADRGEAQRAELRLVRERLGPPGASRRAAEEVARLMQ
jgi:lipid-A-disaccharide synthase